MSLATSLRPRLPALLLLLTLAGTAGALGGDGPAEPVELDADTLAYLDQAVADGWMDPALADDLRALADAPDARLRDSVYDRYLAALGAAPAEERTAGAAPSCEDTCRAQFEACMRLCRDDGGRCLEAEGTRDVCDLLQEPCVDACEAAYRACMEACEAIPTQARIADPVPAATTATNTAGPCEDLCRAQYDACLDAGGDPHVCRLLYERCLAACGGDPATVRDDADPRSLATVARGA